MAKVTRVMRYEILGMKDNEDKFMKEMLSELRYETWKVFNRAVQMYWDIDNVSYAFKQKYGEGIQMKQVVGKEKDSYMDTTLKEEFTKLNTTSIEQVRQKVKQQWSKNKKEVITGKASVLSYKRKNANIRFRNNQIKIQNIDGENYIVSLRLLNTPYAKKLHEEGFEIITNKKEGKRNKKEIKIVKKNNDDMWVHFNIKAYEGSNKAIIDRLISGEYKIGTSEILYCDRKKKYYINLAYTFETVEAKLDENKIMGIDVGVNIPATLAINGDDYYRQFIGDGKVIRDFQNQVEARKKRLQRAAKCAGDGSVGHGRKTRTKSVLKVSDKIARFKEQKNHVWSREIINEAVKNQCGVIQMEKLSGINEKEAFLKQWTYYQLQEKIKYKAEEHGIKVIEIDPKYTSARCNKCGFIHSSKNKDVWRPSQETFLCQKCNHKTHADLNAAKNISMPDIEKIIKEQWEYQQKQERNLKYVID